MDGHEESLDEDPLSRIADSKPSPEEQVYFQELKNKLGEFIDAASKSIGMEVKGSVVEKTTLSAFESSNLDGLLKEKNITDIVICGMQSDHCINANSRGAKALGYGVTVIGDAHSTTKSETQTAEQIIDDINKNLSSVVKVTSLEQWLGTNK